MVKNHPNFQTINPQFQDATADELQDKRKYEEEEEEPLELRFDHIYVYPDIIPNSAKIFYCKHHILPWCVEKEMPCYHCICKYCQKLPKMYRKKDDDPKCQECRPDEYDFNHSDEKYHYKRYVPLDFYPICNDDDN